MVLYEMLRGTRLFDIEMGTREFGEPVGFDATGIEPGLVQIIARCLAQDPDDRFESVAELAAALMPFAPTRACSHAEAAAAMLRKAGLCVVSQVPDSSPPPPASAPVSLIPPARSHDSLPAIERSVSVVAAKPTKWPLYAGLSVVLAASGILLASRMAPKPMVAASAEPPHAPMEFVAPTPVPSIIKPELKAVEPPVTASSAPHEPVAAPRNGVRPKSPVPSPKTAAMPAAPTGTSEDLGF
jgi:serine/threonine-protein kinase